MLKNITKVDVFYFIVFVAALVIFYLSAVNNI
ncbi:hypothetical protein JOD18_001692 [Gracilibacillus alcaliphilus]|nr:hypothetical protein [Gracilibacillus alcaliphilus]